MSASGVQISGGRPTMQRRVLWLGAYFIIIHAAMAAEGGGCAQNSLNIDRYVDALKGDTHNVANAMFQRVPGDLTMVQDSAAYILRDDVAMQVLPFEHAPTLGGLKTGDRFVSACRVKGQAGDWWLAIKVNDAALLYVPESKAEKADSDAAKVGAEPEKRSKDPLFQGKY
jgi:hypothetical protein